MIQGTCISNDIEMIVFYSVTKQTNSETAVPWEPLKEKPSKESDVKIPPGCLLNVRFPNNASPNVQGTLPVGETFKKFKSHTRSFHVEGIASSASGSKPRATLTQAAATCQVVAWLWDWHDSDPTRAAKRLRPST